MLRFNVPSDSEHLSIWINLSTFEELPLEWQRKTKLTMAQLMAKSPMLEIGGLNPRLIPFADLLSAFPDIDLEKTYVTTHFKLDRPYKWPPV